MGLHLVDLFLGDGQPQFLLGFREGDPQTPPGGVFVLGGPVEAHLRTGVAVGQRTFIRVVAVHESSPPIVQKVFSGKYSIGAGNFNLRTGISFFPVRPGRTGGGSVSSSLSRDGKGRGPVVEKTRQRGRAATASSCVPQIVNMEENPLMSKISRTLGWSENRTMQPPFC